MSGQEDRVKCSESAQVLYGEGYLIGAAHGLTFSTFLIFSIFDSFHFLSLGLVFPHFVHFL